MLQQQQPLTLQIGQREYVRGVQSPISTWYHYSPVMVCFIKLSVSGIVLLHIYYWFHTRFKISTDTPLTKPFKLLCHSIFSTWNKGNMSNSMQGFQKFYVKQQFHWNCGFWLVLKSRIEYKNKKLPEYHFWNSQLNRLFLSGSLPVSSQTILHCHEFRWKDPSWFLFL